jgi:hypothetical protein
METQLRFAVSLAFLYCSGTIDSLAIDNRNAPLTQIGVIAKLTHVSGVIPTPIAFAPHGLDHAHGQIFGYHLMG